MTTDRAMTPSHVRAVRIPRPAPALGMAHASGPGTRHTVVGGPLSSSEDTLDALFTRAARRRPDAVAIQDARGELSFAKAELRATQLASVLIHAGVQLGDPVIIHCDDHQQALVAQLAVLKAGGVCVPAAHGHNRAQLRAIASISGASTVLCSRSTRGAWPRRFAALPLDDQGTTRLAAAHRRESALPLSHPREAAYLMLSGGGPDGPVGYLTDHRAWRLATAQRIRAAGPAPHRVFVAGPPADPRAVSAMWWAFACGGSLRALPDTGAPVARDGMLCAAVFSPEEYDAVVATLPIRPRLVQLLGGPVPDALVARHFAALPGTRLRADFAPIDGALPWTSREVRPTGDAESPGALGTAVPHVRARVLDRNGRAQEVGHEGELCGAGDALPFDAVRRPGIAAPAWEETALLRSRVSVRRSADGGFRLAGPA
ncbi:AMP-binding protein [Streptomyces scabiei]|nr:AMP-binding protein [Streptomyces scabiei]MDX2576992.1 AMP-binding protein [Streptomyces scabiei]MDX2656751.1 AMP-binding protein [Streptomyces scabiei]MDX2726286.1 AMP-binding protein [Streptomyces scabiei]MDX2868224.1 AMP-binding protein [Streptomyces scabiei]MDX2887149.1 AMP-binding protein [Streptomyces scabiei]